MTRRRELSQAERDEAADFAAARAEAGVPRHRRRTRPSTPEVPTLFDVQEMELNFGPQHPSTHGVLRLVLKVDGEKILEAKPDVGYLHRGTEKLFETETYPMGIPHTDRMDYVAAATNNHAFCLTIEKLLGVEIPRRAQLIRVILDELQRLSSHLVWLGTSGIDLGRGDAVLVRVPRARADPRLLRGVLRRAPDPELHADRRPAVRPDAGLGRAGLGVRGRPAGAHRRLRAAADRQPDLEEADGRHRRDLGARSASSGA